MKYYVKVCSWLPADGMAIFPFILVKNEKLKSNNTLITHELIHFKQQIELLILPFYVLYFIFFAVNYLRYFNIQQAYRNIPFEKEAYYHENNAEYLALRKFFAWFSSNFNIS